MLLNRDDWYDVAHDLDWSLSYVEHEDAFPVAWTGSNNIPHEAWRAWEESCKPAAKTTRRSAGRGAAATFEANEVKAQSGNLKSLGRDTSCKAERDSI